MLERTAPKSRISEGEGIRSGIIKRFFDYFLAYVKFCTRPRVFPSPFYLTHGNRIILHIPMTFE